MKAILTGGAGFIGSCFLWKLNQMGIDQVLIVDSDLDGLKPKNLAHHRYTDFIPKKAFLESLEGKAPECDALIHLGACADTTERDVNYLTLNNFVYSQRCAQWALRKGIPFLYASSAAIYGDGAFGYSDDDSLLPTLKPLNPYGDSKHQFDLWLSREKLTGSVVGLRYFNVFGPNEYHKGEMRSMVHKAFGQVQEKGAIRLFASSRPGDEDGSETRDFVYVKDIVAVMGYFLEHPDRRGIFNLGSGKARSFKDLGTAVFKAMGKETRIEYFPMPEKLKGQYQYFTQADLKKLRAAGYDKPFSSLEDSVKDYVQTHLQKPDPHL